MNKKKKQWDKEHGPCCQDELDSETSETDSGKTTQQDWHMITNDKDLREDKTYKANMENPYSEKYATMIEAKKEERGDPQKNDIPQRGWKEKGRKKIHQWMPIATGARTASPVERTQINKEKVSG